MNRIKRDYCSNGRHPSVARVRPEYDTRRDQGGCGLGKMHVLRGAYKGCGRQLEQKGSIRRIK